MKKNPNAIARLVLAIAIALSSANVMVGIGWPSVPERIMCGVMMVVFSAVTIVRTLRLLPDWAGYVTNPKRQLIGDLVEAAGGVTATAWLITFLARAMFDVLPGETFPESALFALLFVTGTILVLAFLADAIWKFGEAVKTYKKAKHEPEVEKEKGKGLVTLEDILRDYMGCKNPMLPKPMKIPDGLGGYDTRYLTDEGLVAHEALVRLLFAVGNLTETQQQMEHVATVLDAILDDDIY